MVEATANSVEDFSSRDYRLNYSLGRVMLSRGRIAHLMRREHRAMFQGRVVD